MTKSEKRYTQCKLIRDGSIHLVSWIPEECAIVGANVLLKETRQSNPVKYLVEQTYGSCPENVLNMIEDARKDRAITLE